MHSVLKNAPEKFGRIRWCLWFECLYLESLENVRLKYFCGIKRCKIDEHCEFSELGDKGKISVGLAVGCCSQVLFIPTETFFLYQLFTVLAVFSSGYISYQYMRGFFERIRCFVSSVFSINDKHDGDDRCPAVGESQSGNKSDSLYYMTDEEYAVPFSPEYSYLEEYKKITPGTGTSFR